MSAEKCPVCRSDVLYSAHGATAYKCGHGMGQKCANAERLVIEKTAEVERLTVKLAKWETELSKVMPPNFKDWWQNSRDEWPEIARWVIQSGRAQQSSAWEHVEKLTILVEQLERELRDANELIHLMSMRKET